MNLPTVLTRKQVASLLEISVDQLRRREAALGLARAKITVSRQCIRYRAADVYRILLMAIN